MFDELKRKCCEANLEIPLLELAIYTFGNVSCADRENGVFAIKPSGVDYKLLTWRDMVILDFDGNVVEGALRPSSDSRTHAVLYRCFADIGAVVHTHSPYATAWAQAMRDIPIYGTTHADNSIGAIPCTEWMSDECLKLDYEEQMGFLIVDCMRRRHLRPEENPMVLVGGHGPFAWGKDGEDAVRYAKVFEEVAKMAQLTETINANATSLKTTIINKHYLRKHGKNSYYGQPAGSVVTH